MIHFIHCSFHCFLLMWCQGFLWASHPAATAPSLIPPSSKCASQVTDGGCLYNVSYGCNFGPARISLQHKNQSAAYASRYSLTSACSIRIRLQPHLNLQHTHLSTARASVYNIRISLLQKHTYPPVAVGWCACCRLVCRLQANVWL